VNPLASGLLISSEELPVYDTNTSRWLQPDPKGFDALDPNLYRGMGNDPTNATDPSGLAPLGLSFRHMVPPDQLQYLEKVLRESSELSSSEAKDIVLGTAQYLGRGDQQSIAIRGAIRDLFSPGAKNEHAFKEAFKSVMLGGRPQKPNHRDIQDKIDALIQAMSNANYGVRENATKELQSLGLAIETQCIEALRKRPALDPDLSKRLKRVLDEVDSEVLYQKREQFLDFMTWMIRFSSPFAPRPNYDALVDELIRAGPSELPRIRALISWKRQQAGQ
jgi:hypothetical protein